MSNKFTYMTFQKGIEAFPKLWEEIKRGKPINKVTLYSSFFTDTNKFGDPKNENYSIRGSEIPIDKMIVSGNHGCKKRLLNGIPNHCKWIEMGYDKENGVYTLVDANISD